MKADGEPLRAKERRLTACIAGLLSISASRVVSRSDNPNEAVGSLLEILVSTLHLDFAYASFKIAGVSKPVAISATTNPAVSKKLEPALRSVVDAWLEDRFRISPFTFQRVTPNGERSVVLLRLGLRTQTGWLLACSGRLDFPTQTERLLLVAAASQGTLGIEQAALLRQQTRLAQRLERNVEGRTKELRAANAELADALKQVEMLRDALEKENLEFRAQAAELRGGLSPWLLTRARALMSEDLSGRIPLQQIAQACDLSVRHFARAFRQSLGIPPHRWLLNLRVEHAKKLLRDQQLSLFDIAIACGFGDQSHFSRAFSQAVGLSPGLWRRMRSTPQLPTSRPNSARSGQHKESLAPRSKQASANTGATRRMARPRRTSQI